MICKCGGDMQVTGTAELNNEIYRTRKCKSCGKIIATHEYRIPRSRAKEAFKARAKKYAVAPGDRVYSDYYDANGKVTVNLED